MTKSALERAQEAAGDERRRAVDFWEKHHYLVEDRDTERVQTYRKPKGKRKKKVTSVRTVPYWDGMLNRDADFSEAKRFVPMVATPARRWTLEDEAKVDRVEGALKAMPAKQRKLLLDYYVGGVPLRKLRHAEESRQAVFHRVMRAKARFVKELRSREPAAH